MKLIPIKTDASGALSPSQPIPSNAIRVVCDGVNYIVYQPGDTIPAQWQ
jgi:hypothetical protein